MLFQIISEELFLPKNLAEMRTKCNYDKAVNRGYHFFNLVQSETYKWIKRKGRRAVDKCLPKSPPQTTFW